MLDCDGNGATPIGINTQYKEIQIILMRLQKHLTSGTRITRITFSAIFRLNLMEFKVNEIQTLNRMDQGRKTFTTYRPGMGEKCKLFSFLQFFSTSSGPF